MNRKEKERLQDTEEEIKRKYFKYISFKKNMEIRKKSVLICLFIVLTLIISVTAIAIVSAQDDSTKVDNAFKWLITKVKGKWSSLNTKQDVFSVLALKCNSTYFDPGNRSLYNKSFSSPTMRCWGPGPSRPSSLDGCLLTETSLAKVALDSWQDNTTKVKNWILSRNMTQVSGIDWYLQVDVDRGYTADCEIIYGGNEEKGFEVAADKKVTVSGSSKCFTVVAAEPYWFRIIASADCYSNRYTIKCVSNATIYRASLLYRKSNDPTHVWYVSSETQSGRPGVPGSPRIEDQPNPLELQVPSYCLANPGQSSCDYEGTSWSAYALSKEGDTRDANMFIPYLVVFGEQYGQYFPASFLYPITGQQRYNDEIIQAQKIVGTDKGYWLIQPIVYGRVYDTSHAGLALSSSSGDAVTKAKNYLLANQERDGNLVSTGYGESQKESIRDTAFALWVFWSASCPGGGGGGVENNSCIDQGFDFRCTDNLTCNPDEIEVFNLTCASGEICCKYIGTGGPSSCSEAGGACKNVSCNASEYEIQTITCPDLGFCCKPFANAYCNEVGEICNVDENCTGDEVDTIDGKCCIGLCTTGTEEGKLCSELGVECTTGDTCINSITLREIEFIKTQDTDRCCAGSNVECVQDVSCSSIGTECRADEECINGEVKKTKDTENCCTGQCLGTCSSKGGSICATDEKCSGTLDYSSESPSVKRCCVGGTCSKPASLWWIWLIVIILVIGVAVYLYFFKFKKKKIKGEGKPGLFEFPITRPPIRPLPQQPRPMPSSRPLFKPTPMTQAKPQPSATFKPSPLKQPLPKAPTAPTPQPKGKTEAELEKTLSKLKKLTKTKK